MRVVILRLEMGKNTSTLLGKILRIDIDNGDPYGIPPDKPLLRGWSG